MPLPEICHLVKTWGNKSGSWGAPRNMTQDRIGKSFTVIFTNGDPPNNPYEPARMLCVRGRFYP